MMASLIMDVVVALLLVAMIWVAWQLNTRLRVLRSDSERMERLIAGLSAASHQAEEAVVGLRRSTGDVGKQLQIAIDRGNSLLTDLHFMNDKAEEAANRLEAAIQDHRAPAMSAPMTTSARAPVQPQVQAPLPIAADPAAKDIQHRLSALLKQAEATARNPRAARPKQDPPPRAAAAAAPEEEQRSGSLQSRAEREFLKALELRK